MKFCPNCGGESKGPLHSHCAKRLRRFAEENKDSENRWVKLYVERARRLVRKYDEWLEGGE